MRSRLILFLLAAILCSCLTQGGSDLERRSLAHGGAAASESEEERKHLPMNVLPCMSRWRLDKADRSAWEAAFSAADSDGDGLLRLRQVGRVFQIYLSNRQEGHLDFG
jgi:hypothetical protein